MALFELKQEYSGAEGAAPPLTFKDCAAADIDAAFFEQDEHADWHTVDGKDALVIVDDQRLKEHSAHWEAGAKQNFDSITDRCRIDRHYHSDTDEDGTRYDFYTISEHYRYVERTKLMEETRKATEIAFVTLAESGSIDAVTAGEHKSLFETWQTGVAYTVGQLRNWGNKLYKCVQAHTSQAGWEPDKAASLWSAASDPAEEWPEWSKPVGAHDAYAKGDKVSHNGKHWTSTADANVWEPGVYGWTEATA